jgi:hypothetical protein
VKAAATDAGDGSCDRFNRFNLPWFTVLERSVFLSLETFSNLVVVTGFFCYQLDSSFFTQLLNASLET